LNNTLQPFVQVLLELARTRGWHGLKANFPQNLHHDFAASLPPPVDGLFAHSSPLGNLVYGDPVVAPLGHDLQGCSHNSLPACLTSFPSRSGHLSSNLKPQ